MMLIQWWPQRYIKEFFAGDWIMILNTTIYKFILPMDCDFTSKNFAPVIRRLRVLLKKRPVLNYRKKVK